MFTTMLHLNNLKGEFMKSLMANMIKNKSAKIKADANKNKKLVASRTTKLKHEQPVETVLEEKAVMKESKTLMLD